MPDTAAAPPEFPWRASLITRVAVLCTLLLVCLFAAVYAITTHFYQEVSREMEAQAEAISDSIVVMLDENPEAPLDQLEGDMVRLHPGFDEIELIEAPENGGDIRSFSLEQQADGRLRKVARLTFSIDDREFMLVASVASSPQTEVIRAFQNRNLWLITGVFVLVLGLMVYFIARSLRPLRELSQTCAEISSGTLRAVPEHPRTSGEIRSLERTFNEMVESLHEKEEMEKKLRQAQRLSSIGTLAAGVAHDVRNPLNAIKLISSHTLDTLESADDRDTARKQLQTIQREVHRLEDIVSSFLSLAREGVLQPEPHAVDELLEECVRLVQKDAEKREVRLTTELRAGDTKFMLDRKQWNRAILNVIINALEACPEGGRVRIFSRLTGAECQVEVRDDGPGLTPEAVEHAFDPYFTTKETGTGLGLSLTRGIVEEHGGRIELSGTEGQGCQVVIALPLERHVT